MSIALWLVCGFVGSILFLISVNREAGLPTLRLSDLAYMFLLTLAGPIALVVAGVHWVFAFATRVVGWAIKKYFGGNDPTIIP